MSALLVMCFPRSFSLVPFCFNDIWIGLSLSTVFLLYAVPGQMCRDHQSVGTIHFAVADSACCFVFLECRRLGCRHMFFVPHVVVHAMPNARAAHSRIVCRLCSLLAVLHKCRVDVAATRPIKGVDRVYRAPSSTCGPFLVLLTASLAAGRAFRHLF